MRPSGSVLRAAVFLGVVLLIVIGSAAGSFTGGFAGEPAEPDDHPEFDPASIVPERAESGGVPAADRAAAEGTVVVDLAHRNRVRPDEIQPLITAVVEAGYRVEFVEATDDLEGALDRADAFVVIDPGERYSTADADRVEAFVDDGGRLVLLGEPTQFTVSEESLDGSLSTDRNRLTSLASRFGIEFGSDYLFNMERNDGNFRNVIAESAGDGPLADGVEETALAAPVKVDAADAEEVLVAADGTRTSRTDAEGEYAIAVRAGNVVAVGDTSFLERGNDDVLDNDVFVGNLATFIVGGGGAADADDDRS